MKVLFVGLGSIACRHISNIKKLGIKDLEIEVVRSGKGKEPNSDLNKMITQIIMSEEDLSDSYDAIFITNPTAYHYDSLTKYKNYSDNFFIEKPVFLTGKENIQPFMDEKKQYYVACPLRYSNVIEWLKSNYDFSSVYSIRVISSSYLPDWRPDVDYRKTYSARRDLGGGVSIDLIHEWDYITHLIGFPKSVYSIISKKSPLDTDTDDIAVYIAEYTDKIVELHLDYFGKKTMRVIELFSAEDTVVIDLIEQRIRWLKSGKELILAEDRDSYQIKELRNFMRIVSGEADNNSSIENACKVVRIGRGII